MKNSQRTEILVLGILLGIAVGVLLAILFYIPLFSFTDQPFSLFALFDLHRQIPAILIVDLLIPAGGLAGYFFASLRIADLKARQQVLDQSARRSDRIKEILNDLSVGKLEAVVNEEDIDVDLLDAINNLQLRLKSNRDKENQTRREESQRNWTSQGLAEFGDILRMTSTNLEELGYSVISNLVKYLDINQGGFFILQEEEDEPFLEMIACHAYDRKKFPGHRVSMGEGIIGEVALEKKSYYTNKIPEGYLTITSGLGKATPRHLLIVPLVMNEKLFGVFELASFTKFEPYQIQFVERVAENSATTINIIQSNKRTENLLLETQQQTAQLAQKEVELMRNMDQLKNTQLEAARQSEEFISFTNTVNHTLIRAEYDVNGLLVYANTRFLRKLGYSGNREVNNKHISIFIHEMDRDWFDSIWKRLSGGGMHFEGYMRHVTKLGKDLWTMATYTCVRSEDGTVEKILFLAIDSTQQKEESLGYEGQIKAIDKLSPKAEFTPDGKLIGFNELFSSTLEYSGEEMHQKNIFDFLPPSDQENFNEIWETVIKGNAYSGQLRMLGRYEKEYWFRATFTSIDDMYGEVERIVFLAFETTKEKELELSMRDQNAILKEKEESMRLQSIDLRRQLKELEARLMDETQTISMINKKYVDLTESLPLPIVGINNEGFIVVFNRAAEKLWKLNKKDILEMKSTALLNKHQKEEFLKGFVDFGTPIKSINKRKRSQLILADEQTLSSTISIVRSDSGSAAVNFLILHP